MSLYLAYDGSINGDWVARYAISIVRHLPDRRLHIVHVRSGEIADKLLMRKLRGVKQDGAAAGVSVSIEMVPMQGSVFATLAAAIPDGSEVFLMCGTRVRGGRHGYLSGTVAEKLLARRTSNVVAMRVVHPGLLGVAHIVLLAITGARPPFDSVLPFLDLMVPEVKSLHILNAFKLRRAAQTHLTHRRLSKLRAEGLVQARSVERTIMERTGLTDTMIDSTVRVTDDWVMETLILASRHKSQLICLSVPPPSFRDALPFANPIERMLRDAPCDVALVSPARGLN